MKKVLASVLVVAAVLLCAMSDAWAKNLPDSLNFGNWEVFEGFADMGPTINYTESDKQGLWVLFPPNFEYHIMMFGPKMKPGSYNHLKGKTIPGKIQVDNRRTYDVNFKCAVDDKGDSLTIHLPEDFNETLVQEANKGSVLRVTAGGKKPILTLEYSLDGFTDALEYCLELLDS